MLDSIKDWFVDRLHKYMDAAREIVENDEGIRSAGTYYSTVKAILKKKGIIKSDACRSPIRRLTAQEYGKLDDIMTAYEALL